MTQPQQTAPPIPLFAHDVDLTVLVTCYNEREFILDTLHELTSALAEWGGSHEVIIVDDCSPDGSGEMLEQHLRDNPMPQVRLVRNAANKGLSKNFIDGAFLGRGKYYRLCCGDNAESREALVHIYRQIGKADLIIPYQVQDEVRGKLWHRRIISRLFTALVNLLTDNDIRYYNSLPVFLREHVIRFPPQSYGFGFQADIVTRILEEDVTYLQTRHLGPRDLKGKDSTALSMRNLLSVMHTFVEISIRRLRRTIYGKGMPRAREIRIEP
ncbi:MAG TPA: glycosyltransferase family 2 protein [Humidesulfovibrio sp.]|uniref:glycosyltransferase family 2 protein n=1 Tax=Humidesulfovibrio sp. TaxID=2910988 RepID=UPI002B771A68|nr:glycosyltransferase family 2 protein [Humidesulfovibrio sp.]HWR03893.1 glycosyltransferase family 2 protein [Humidesulfovibrio sp.]